MEMILDALASSLGEQLVKMVNDEASMLLGASKEVEKLSETLSSLKMFLADAERRHITDVTKEDEYVHEWVRKLKDAIYDGTDIVDDVHLKVEKRRTSMGSCSSSESLFWCLQDPLFTHRIGSRVKELNQRMDGLFSKQAELLKFSITSGNSHSGSNPRRTAPGIIHEDVVGDKIEQDKQKLVDILINRDNDDEDDVGVLVVAILGVGGIGKTTLAKEIFNDQAIHDTFDSKIWLSHPRLQ